MRSNIVQTDPPLLSVLNRGENARPWGDLKTIYILFMRLEKFNCCINKWAKCKPSLDKGVLWALSG